MTSATQHGTGEWFTGADRGPWRSLMLWPMLVLAISLSFTFKLWQDVAREREQDLASRFEHQTLDFAERLKSEMATHDVLLRGLAGLFNASKPVTRSDFRRYVENLQFGAKDSGFAALSYHEVVSSRALSRHVAKQRQGGLTDYHVFPIGERGQYAPMVFIEPLSEANRKVLGFDPLAIAAERVAIERARDSGEVTISAKLTLAQDSGESAPGFVMYAPIYRGASPRGNLAERRASFVGWVDAPFRMPDLVAHVFRQEPTEIDFEIFDGPLQTEGNSLFTVNRSLRAEALTGEGFHRVQPLEVGGHLWTLVFHSRPDFGAGAVRQKPQLVAWIGILLSFLLSLAVMLAVRFQRRRVRQSLQLEAETHAAERLRQEERFSLALSIAHAGTWEWDLRSNEHIWSDQLWQLHGIEKGSAKPSYATWVDAIHPEDRQRVEATTRLAVREGREYEVEFRTRLPEGSSRWMMSRGFPLTGEDGRPAQYLGVILDVSARKQAETLSRESEQHFRTLANGGSMLIWTSGLDMLCNYFNEPWLRFTGRTLEQEVGNGWTEGLHPDDFKLCVETYVSSFEQRQPFSMEYRIRHADGSYRWIRDDGNPRYDSQGEFLGYIGFCMDITERKLAAEQIEQLAFYDPLTRLPNRRLMLDRLEQAMISCVRHGRQGAVMLIDLDHFKTLNDTHGHDVGDQLLVEVARRLEFCIRECDTVARLGGDEFVVILRDLDETAVAATQAENVGEKIHTALRQPYLLELAAGDGPIGRHSHLCTSSIGITLFRDQSVTIDELLRRADTAMYQVKAADRNALRFFDPAMQEAIEARARIEVELRNAIVEKQFCLYYQPQVDSFGEVIGAEALVRWQHPERGIVSPAEFVSLAEESGLILPLGHQVLEIACAQLASWANIPDMSHLTLAVNVSARQFSMPNFVEQILSLVEYHGVKPNKLKLELTESLLLENVEAIITKMIALKARGVGFSLDDFGTGYSSLNYLKRLPLDQLKIDQSFVRDVLSDDNDAAIARTVVALGQSLGLAVIAEGVETGGQCDFLAEIGCHAYQGYFFSRPQPVDGFQAFVRQSGSRPQGVASGSGKEIGRHLYRAANWRA